MRRQRRNETGIERVWRSYLKLQLFGVIALIIVVGGLLLWMKLSVNRMKVEWKETDARWEQIIKQKEDDMQKKYKSFEESTNQDVQNTIDEIQRNTEDTTGAEYYQEDVYTAPETQESEQPTHETNATQESAYETRELPEPVPDVSKQLRPTDEETVEFDDDGNPIDKSTQTEEED